MSARLLRHRLPEVPTASKYISRKVDTALRAGAAALGVWNGESSFSSSCWSYVPLIICVSPKHDAGDPFPGQHCEMNLRVV